MSQYNDQDAIIFSEELERIYKEDLGREPRDTHIDVLGAARWYGDYRFLTTIAGLSSEQATQGIRNEIYKIVGIPIPTVGGLVGPVRREGNLGWRDDTGYVNPLVVHFGDGLSLDIRNPELCDHILDAFADAGYHAVRTWTVLRGNYWKGRECGPRYQQEYKAAVVEFAHKLSVRGLRWLVSQGDLLAEYTTQAERKSVLRDIVEAINTVDPNLILAIDMGNESWQNGEGDPERLKELARFVETLVGKNVTITLTSPPSEEAADLNALTYHVFDVHGSRDGRWWDKIRHIFSIGYEGRPSSRIGIQSEPFGAGDLVSATSNKDEIDDDVCALGAAMSYLARQMWVYFSGPGVKSDAGEEFWNMPGFYIVPDTIKRLPKDIMTFSKLCHGGKSQADRVFAVPAEDETRADHAINADGRFVCIMYGPNWKRCKTVRPHQVLDEIVLGDKGRIVIGQLS